ncbi:DUF6251 family protein [Streptomyces sp. SL13]|uniref:DUF6251 family protein n=1 Tax=Streptantibioticus silvisoli TaxID=2705255 RepID=A0AA90GZN6_9ACTN|nr:DUF6251 family protein [Streptantibioticus silvisoli]MDI5968626.1 DUF6251 family protein [Streptantibioticus silvisoli]
MTDRYRFDNPLPAPTTVPPTVHQPYIPAACETTPQMVVQHIHQAAPDRTVQRVALGAGVGGGAVVAGVYFGPLLVAALASMAASLAVVALVAVAAGWAVVHVVRAVDGHADAKTARKSLTRKGR